MRGASGPLAPAAVPASADLPILAALVMLGASILALGLSSLAFLWRGRARGTTRPGQTGRHWSGDNHAARMHSAYFSKERRARAIRERERHARPSARAPEAEPAAAPPDTPAAVRSRTEVEHRAVLDLDGEVTAMSLRRAYLRQIAAYHPDKVAGLGAKLQQVAEEETKRINEAYAFFRQHHGL